MGKILILLLFLFCISPIYGKCRRDAKVKYRQNYGWSKTYSVEVNFLTGYELNEATRGYRYDSYANYAVIFWREGEATVIKISSNPLLCGIEVDCKCIDSLLFDLEGKDQDGDIWNICFKDYCN